MPKTRTQPHTPGLMRVLFRPWLLISLLLHAAVLVLPLLPGDSGTDLSLSSDSDSPEPDSPELSVSLSPAPAATPPVVQPSLSPVALPAPLPPPARVAVPRPTTVPRPRPPALASTPPPLATPAPPPAAAPSPVASPPAPTPSPTPTATAAPSPAPVPTPGVLNPPPALWGATAAPSPAPVPTPIPMPSPEASPDLQVSPSSVPYADFPHPDGARADCGGFLNCWRLADADGRPVQAIARDLQATLQAQGYQAQRLEPADDTGSSLYSVTRPGEPPYYVNVISTFNQGTVYLLTDEPMTAEAIRGVREGRVPAPQPSEPPPARQNPLLGG